MGVDVPILADNGEIKGWCSVTKPSELNKVITQKNQRCLHQAVSTPLGHGEGFELFHGEDRHETAKKVLAGKLEWKYLVDEVNNYIENIQQAYDAKGLQEEIKIINATVTVEEFCYYFTKNKESAESSPSGWHIGHWPYWEMTSWLN